MLTTIYKGNNGHKWSVSVIINTTRLPYVVVVVVVVFRDQMHTSYLVNIAFRDTYTQCVNVCVCVCVCVNVRVCVCLCVLSHLSGVFYGSSFGNFRLFTCYR